MTPRFTGVRLLADNHDAWQAKRHLIAKARHTLDLCYFILELDGTTSQLLLDLVAAAERGVQVRLLVDYFMTFEQAPALRALGQLPNIDVRRYGPPMPAWLAALDAAGIDRTGFVKGLMAANGAMLAQALQSNTIFAPAVAEQVAALDGQPGLAAVNFPLQVQRAFEAGAAAVGKPAPAPLTASASASGNRAALVRKVAVAMQVLRGLKQFLHRSHHKLLLADGRHFIMGGRNLADAYQCAAPAQGHAFQDTDIMAFDHRGRGGASSHQATFQTLWTSAPAVGIARPDPLDARPPLPLDSLRDTARAMATRKPGAVFRAGLKLPDMDGVLVDNLPGDRGDTAITQAYIQHIGQLVAARGSHGGDTIDIVSAYLALADDAADSTALFALRNAIVAAAQAGLAVNIHTNSIASTDLKAINQAAYPKLVALIDAGVNVFELADGQGSLHTKCAAIGDNCLIVGSYNMDPRSELYDTNNLIVLNDSTGAATATFRQTRIKALKWTQLTAAAARQLAAGTAPKSGSPLLRNNL